MNPLNYASLEASKRLAEAGIVLETELYWRVWPARSNAQGGSELVDEETKIGFQKTRPLDADDEIDGPGVLYYPAPSMAEVWRELPGRVEIYQKRWNLEISKGCATGTQETHGGYADGDSVPSAFCYCLSTNPTDALIDLLIWVRKEANHA